MLTAIAGRQPRPLPPGPETSLGILLAGLFLLRGGPGGQHPGRPVPPREGDAAGHLPGGGVASAVEGRALRQR